MTRRHHGRCVRAQRTFTAPAADVWRAWSDPEQIAQWFVDRAEGTCKPGEVMTWIFKAFNYRLPVPILEAIEGSRLVTGADAGVAGPLPVLMEIDIETTSGGCTLRLVNSGFGEEADRDKDDEVEGVRSGWECALASLDHWLARGKPMGRVHRIAIRPTQASWATLASLYAGRDGLARWLDGVTAPERLAAGDRITATLGGVPLTGTVLVHTGREVVLDWPEAAGLVSLKAFPMGPARALALDVGAWGDRAPAAVAAIERAVERLAAAASQQG